jgi:hypothetical protein
MKNHTLRSGQMPVPQGFHEFCMLAPYNTATWGIFNSPENAAKLHFTKTKAGDTFFSQDQPRAGSAAFDHIFFSESPKSLNQILIAIS